jgi:hypothetical protein
MAAMSGTFASWLYNNRPYSTEGALGFVVGKSYLRRDGKLVKIVAINDRGDCVQGDDAECTNLGWRYNRPGDMGRCTGAMVDDPMNLMPDFPVGHPNAACEGFRIEVCMMGANKTPEQRALFRELLDIRYKLDELKAFAKEHDEWKQAWEHVFSHDIEKRVKNICLDLGLCFHWDDPDSTHKRDVEAYDWAFNCFIEDHRPFYAA